MKKLSKKPMVIYVQKKWTFLLESSSFQTWCWKNSRLTHAVLFVRFGMQKFTKTWSGKLDFSRFFCLFLWSQCSSWYFSRRGYYEKEHDGFFFIIKVVYSPRRMLPVYCQLKKIWAGTNSKTNRKSWGKTERDKTIRERMIAKFEITTVRTQSNQNK